MGMLFLWLVANADLMQGHCIAGTTIGPGLAHAHAALDLALLQGGQYTIGTASVTKQSAKLQVRRNAARAHGMRRGGPCAIYLIREPL